MAGASGSGDATVRAEQRRLAVLARYDVLDTGAEADFNLITEMAAQMLGAESSFICFGDSKRLWFKANTDGPVGEIKRDVSVCDLVIRTATPLTVCDLQADSRFNHVFDAANPPAIRFYAGMPLITEENCCVGVLAVTDPNTRAEPSSTQMRGLARLADMVMLQLEHRRTRLELQRITARAVRMEAIQSVLAGASTCEQALSGLLEQMCRWHKAAIGRMWKVFACDAVMAEISHYKDDRIPSDSYYDHPRPELVPVANSNTAASILSNQPLILRYGLIENPQRYPLLPVAIASGLSSQVTYPIWVEGERFGIALAFREDREDLAEVLADIASMENLIRPTVLRKVTEERLVLLGQALDRANEGVLITGALPGRGGDPRVIYANGGFCQMTGYTAAEVIGQSPLLLQGPQTDRGVMEQMAAALANGQPCHTEWLAHRKAGDTIWVDMNLTPLRNAAGVPTHFVSILRDVTQKRMQDAALMQSEKLKTIGQLTGGIAHDFNNLLTVVTLNLEDAISRLQVYDPLLNLLQPAMHASIRGAELTAQLTAYARRAPLRPQRVRVKTVLDNLQVLLKRTIGEQFSLQVQLQPDDISAHADPGQLENALMNLVINARDAMPKGGVIRLQASEVELAADSEDLLEDMEPGRYTRLSVVDSGDGIPDEIIARVFDPFFTTKEVGKGSGLGLSMVYGFARQSGGHVTLHSRRGYGTEAAVFLPAVQAPARVVVAPLAAPARSAGTRVLMVEDHPLVLEAVEAILTQSGFSVTTSSSAADAIDTLRAGVTFDLLFTDMMLPGELGGIDLVRAAVDLAPEMRILVTSGYAEQSFPMVAEMAPDAEFLAKPYKRHELMQKLQAMFPGVVIREIAGRSAAADR